MNAKVNRQEEIAKKSQSSYLVIYISTLQSLSVNEPSGDNNVLS